MVYFDLLRKKWAFLVIVTVAVALLFFGYAQVTEKTIFSATAKIMLHFDQEASLSPTTVTELDYVTKQTVYLINSTNYIQERLKQTGYPQSVPFDGSIKSDQLIGSIIGTTVSCSTAKQAEEIANNISINAINAIKPLHIPIKAVIIQKPVAVLVTEMNKIKRVAYGAAFGLILGMCLTLLQYYFKNTIKSEAETYGLLHLPILAKFEGAKQKIFPSKKTTNNSEAINFIGSLVRYRKDGDQTGVICIASASADNTKQDHAIYKMLADYLSGYQKKTLLVDLHEISSPTSSIVSQFGLWDVLDGNCELGDAVINSPEQMAAAYIPVVSTRTSSHRDLDVESLRRLLAEALMQYDYVFLNVPNLMQSPELVSAGILANKTLYVVQLNRTNPLDANAGLALLKSSGVTVDGCIITNASTF